MIQLPGKIRQFIISLVNDRMVKITGFNQLHFLLDTEDIFHFAVYKLHNHYNEQQDRSNCRHNEKTNHEGKTDKGIDNKIGFTIMKLQRIFLIVRLIQIQPEGHGTHICLILHRTE